MDYVRRMRRLRPRGRLVAFAAITGLAVAVPVVVSVWVPGTRGSHHPVAQVVLQPPLAAVYRSAERAQRPESAPSIVRATSSGRGAGVPPGSGSSLPSQRALLIWGALAAMVAGLARLVLTGLPPAGGRPGGRS